MALRTNYFHFSSYICVRSLGCLLNPGRLFLCLLSRSTRQTYHLVLPVDSNRYIFPLLGHQRPPLWTPVRHVGTICFGYYHPSGSYAFFSRVCFINTGFLCRTITAVGLFSFCNCRYERPTEKASGRSVYMLPRCSGPSNSCFFITLSCIF